MESDNKIKVDSPDGYKWLVMWMNGEVIERAIYSDLQEICNMIGISKSTLQRRLRENKNKIQARGVKIIRTPYFKSNRGKQTKMNGKDVLHMDQNV
jgi:hypothetical protein